MLRILTSGYDKNKTDAMFSLIEKAVNKNDDIIIIVPDQYSFEYDKNLYKFLGAKKFNQLKVISFKKLANEILETYGTTEGEYADDNTKQLIMYLAIKELKSNKKVTFYKKQIEKPEFITNALDMVNDFRHSEILPEKLESSKQILSGALAEKVNDLTYLYSTYCDLLKNSGFKDSLTKICEASKLSKENKYFDGKTIFIDKFNNFTQDEVSMLDSIFLSNIELNISLTNGKGKNSESSISPFINIVQTQTMLLAMAKEHSFEIQKIDIVEESCREKSLLHIAQNIFNPLKNSCNETHGIKIIPAENMYQECEYVASKIKRLVCDEGYSYNDFAIISRQLGDYTSIISSTFERYEIPYFMDTTNPICQKALILYVMSILKTVTTKEFKTENILSYMKSTLSMFSDAEVSNLEDFCFKWNVNGDMWLQDFYDNSKEENNDENKESESSINKIRKIAIKPLSEFKNSVQDKPTCEICKSLYKLFDDLKLPLIMSNIINSSESVVKDENQRIETAREFKQLWGLLTTSIRSIYNVLGNQKISIKEFYNILSLLVFNSKISMPPQKLDAVSIASAERSILSDTKIVFIIGVNDGLMPCHVHESGLFTDKDKQILEENGMKISRNILWKIAQERFTTYQALSVATEKLYISYPLSDAKGGARRPSPIIKQIQNMFNDKITEPAWEQSRSFYCANLQSTFYNYCEGFSDKSSEKMSMEKLLQENQEYKEKIQYLNFAKENTRFSISKNTSNEMFLKNDFNISATTVEKYYKCPFSYFCSSGLKLNTNRAMEIDSLNTGNIVHFCLEKIVPQFTNKKNLDSIENRKQIVNSQEEIKTEILELLEKNKKRANGNVDNIFKKLFEGYHQGEEQLEKAIINGLKKDLIDTIEDEIKNLIENYSKKSYDLSEIECEISKQMEEEKIRIKKEVESVLKIYKKEVLGGDFGKSKRFDAMLTMLVPLIADILMNIKKEVNTNIFIPHDFEYNISTDGKSSLDLEVNDEIKIKLRGKIDRVDIFEEDNRKYVRVVDYKTGEKEFAFSEIYNGINMQMILYLMAYINENENENLKPIAVMYMPTGFPSLENFKETDLSNADYNDKKEKNFRKNGMIICQDKLPIEEIFSKDYFKEIKKPMSSTISKDIYKNLEDFIKNKIINMVNNLKEGEIPAIPVMFNNKKPCEYCEYWSICGRQENDESKIIDDDYIKLKEELGIETEEKEGE